MTLLYLDHNVTAYGDGGATWNNLRLITADETIQLAVSNWNLIEIEQDQDRARVIERAQFLASLNPVYMHDMRTLQRQEVMSFLWTHFYKVGSIPISPVVATFSDLLRIEFNIQVRENYSILDYLANAKAGDLAPIEKGKRDMVKALTVLQAADKRLLKVIEKVSFQNHFLSLIPRVGPTGLLVTPEEWFHLQEFCWKHREKLYAMAPALLAEKALGEKRRQNANRLPDSGDAADLMHCAVGISYGDYFITRDGFAAVCAEHATKVLGTYGLRSSALYNSAKALQDHLAARQSR